MLQNRILICTSAGTSDDFLEARYYYPAGGSKNHMGVAATTSKVSCRRQSRHTMAADRVNGFLPSRSLQPHPWLLISGHVLVRRHTLHNLLALDYKISLRATTSRTPVTFNRHWLSNKVLRRY